MRRITYRQNGFVIFLIFIISAEAEISNIIITAFSVRPGVPTAKLWVIKNKNPSLRLEA